MSLKRILLEETLQYNDLYHGTSDKNLKDILHKGFNGSYWSNHLDIAHYYGEVETELDSSSKGYGGNILILKVSVKELNQQYIKPDWNSIKEPLTGILGVSEEEVWDRWEESNGTWENSLEIVGSIYYDHKLKIKEKHIYDIYEP